MALDVSIAPSETSTRSVLLMLNKSLEILDCAKWDCMAFISMSSYGVYRESRPGRNLALSAWSRCRSPRRGLSDDNRFEADRPWKGKVTMVPSGTVPVPGRLGSRRFFACPKHGASPLLPGRPCRPIQPHQTITGTKIVLVAAEVNLFEFLSSRGMQ